MDRKRLCFALAFAAVAFGAIPDAETAASARTLTSHVEELDRMPAMRAQYPVPNDPNQLFYVQRSVNANTVVYAARFDAGGRLDRDTPIDVYWRWYNEGGGRRPLNFMARMMAYGVSLASSSDGGKSIPFSLAALPERKLVVEQDAKGQAEALIQMDNRTARLVYVYLQVDDRGLLPDVTAMEIFGIDKASGKILHEHAVPD